MITEEFFSELGKVKEEFVWKLGSSEGWAAERRAQDRLCVRASHKKLAEGLTLDPIGAVCYAMKQELYQHEDWQDAAAAIELSLISAADLIAAANDCTWKNQDGRRKPDEYLESLRRRLIGTVGLKVP